MSISHAIVFVPVILALSLCAALVSMAFMGGASSGDGGKTVPALSPAVTGYIASSYVNGAQEPAEEGSLNVSHSNGKFPDEVPAG
jgi:hypothetical protein